MSIRDDDRIAFVVHLDKQGWKFPSQNAIDSLAAEFCDLKRDQRRYWRLDEKLKALRRWVENAEAQGWQHVATDSLKALLPVFDPHPNPTQPKDPPQ